MDISPFLKSLADHDASPIVICNLNHEIIYMNTSASKRYEKYGGGELLGKSLLDCHNQRSRDVIKTVLAWFSQSEDNNIIHTVYVEKENKDVYMVALRNDKKELIGYYEKHESRNRDYTTKQI